jgi:hypothetical protein
MMTDYVALANSILESVEINDLWLDFFRKNFDVIERALVYVLKQRDNGLTILPADLKQIFTPFVNPISNINTIIVPSMCYFSLTDFEKNAIEAYTNKQHIKAVVIPMSFTTLNKRRGSHFRLWSMLAVEAFKYLLVACRELKSVLVVRDRVAPSIHTKLIREIQALHNNRIRAGFTLKEVVLESVNSGKLISELK